MHKLRVIQFCTQEVHDRSKSEPLVPQWTRGGYTPDTAAWLKWINENILKTDLYTRYVLELHSLPHQVVYAKMRARHDEFTYQESYFVFVTTFNVNGRSTPPHLRNWLGAIPENNKIPDLYVIGFQVSRKFHILKYIMVKDLKL